MRWAFVISFLLWGQMAFAGSLPEARELLTAGKYDAAIEMALAEETPEGLVLAAETLSAKVMLGYVDDHHKSAKRARKWAEDAAEALPNSQEAQVQFALAYGFETRTSSPFRAWRKKLPKKTRAAIERIRETYPDDPRGDALLGAWHLGIVRKAGVKRGESMFGANEAEGITAYEKAITAAPEDIVIASNYAVTILAMDTEQYFDRGTNVLKHITSIDPKNAVEAEIQTRMRALLSLVDDKDVFAQTVLALVDEGTAPAMEDMP